MMLSFNIVLYGNVIDDKWPKEVSFQNSVTLCAYPFILNAQAKTTMLQTDAELQMQVTDPYKLHFTFCLITFLQLKAFIISSSSINMINCIQYSGSKSDH